MSVVDVNAGMMIANVVESMLPRFSDGKLGIVMSLQMGLTDYGYDREGRTREREELSVCRYPSFLFVRPSNYTRVYYYLPPIKAVGLDLNPTHARKEFVWTMISDHDSCWRDAVESRLSEVYFAMAEKFEGRKIGDMDIRPCDLTKHIFPSFSFPCYVRIEKCEQVNSSANRYSEESRPHRILVVEIDFRRIMSDDEGRLHFKE